MKSFLAICALFLVAAVVRGETENAKKYMESMHETFESCATENGVPSEMIEELPAELSEDDKNKIGCMHSCVMKKTGVWNGSEFDMDKMTETAQEIYKDKAEAVMKSVETCITEVKGIGDDCSTSFAFMECMKKEMK